MNKQQISQLHMQERVLAQLQSETLPDTLSGLSEMIEELKGLVSQVKEQRSAQEYHTKDLTSRKSELRIILQEEISVFSDILVLLSKDGTGDGLSGLSRSITEIRKLREEELLSYAGELLTVLDSHQEDLLAKGYPASRASAMRASYEEYSALKHRPRQAIQEKKRATALIEQLTRRSMDLVKDEMDVLMKAQETEHPELASRYFVAREIVKPGSRPRTSEDDQEVSQEQDSLINREGQSDNNGNPLPPGSSAGSNTGPPRT